jgi:hypothetical protein
VRVAQLRLGGDQIGLAAIALVERVALGTQFRRTPPAARR